MCKSTDGVVLLVPNNDAPDVESIEHRIQQIGRYSRFVKSGLGVIITAFVLSVVLRVPDNLDSVSNTIDSVLQPLIFVGMGLLLFGIGMHLHLMHLNLVRQIQKSQPPNSPGSENELES